MIHDIPLGRARWQIMALAGSGAAIAPARRLYIKLGPVFIYELMALTCGIQALDDNNREVWFASGRRSAGQQLQNRRGLWDDVSALQDRHHQFAALTGDRRGG